MPIVQNPSIGAGAAPLLDTTVNLTAAQILALSGTPVILIPAPGAGKMVVVFLLALSYSAGSIMYGALAGDTLDVEYVAASGIDAIQQVQDFISGTPSSVAVLGGSYANNSLPTADAVNQAVQLRALQTYPAGAILTSTLGAGGAGYAIGDTGTIEDGSDNATYKVLTVDGSGAVLTYQVTDAGQEYTVENAIPTVNGGAQPGVGVGFTVNVTAVTLGNGTLKVVTYYQIIPVP